MLGGLGRPTHIKSMPMNISLDKKGKNRNKELLPRYAIHIIVIAFIFVLPEVVSSFGHELPKIAFLHTLVYIAVFYINYFLFIDKLLFRRHGAIMFTIVNLVIIAAYVGVLYNFYDALIPPRENIMQGIEGEKGPFGNHGPEPGPLLDQGPMHQPRDHAPEFGNSPLARMSSFFPRELILLILSICLSVALKMSEKWRTLRDVERRMLAERRENELQNLKNQLNPHFLFNTLNNIYALIGISQPKAQQAVHDLSVMLRYVLYEDNSRFVPLERDLIFIKKYVELMRLRLNKLVTLTVDIDESQVTGCRIAPLLFISLVENAFKHGVSATIPTMISISIRAENGCVNCHVENSYFPKGDGDRSGSGVGIANLERQLALLYPGRYTYNKGCKGGLYIADLTIDLTKG